MNNITILGRLTNVPELKTTPNGVSVTSFNVAVDRDYKVNGEKMTDFLPCVAWRGTAEFISKYFVKGDMIAIVGSLESRKYTDKNGNNRISYEIIVKSANFCGGKKNNETNNIPDVSEFETVENDEPLPF